MVCVCIYMMCGYMCVYMMWIHVFLSSFASSFLPSFSLPVQTLKRKEKEFEHEMERLAREKIATQQRLAELKNELSQWMDVLEIDRLLRQTVQPEDDQASTSTASGEPRSSPSTATDLTVTAAIAAPQHSYILP